MSHYTRSIISGIALLIMELSLISAVTLTVPGTVHADPGVFYAAPAAQGSGDCSSWANACTLQTALAGASSGDEIWVQAGVHYPGTNRTDTFTLQSGVALYGGFAGTETARDQRDWQANVTVLSGDIDQNDLTDPHGVVTDTAHIVGDNAYHVVVSSGVTETAVLDGFILTAGLADGGVAPLNQGGGLYNYNGHPTLAHLTFSANLAASQGGGLYNTLGSPALEALAFRANRSMSQGGGLFTLNGSPTLEDVAFESNRASHVGGALSNDGGAPSLNGVRFDDNQSGSQGGGLHNRNSSPSLTDVVFRGNMVTDFYSYGGGIYTEAGSPSLTNVLFSGNFSGRLGGALYHTTGSPTLNGVTISGNEAGLSGGGGGIYGGAATLVNVIVWGNRPNQLAGGAMTVSYSLVQGGYAGTGNLDADPLFIAPIDASLAPTTAGNYRLRYASPAIDAGNDAVVTALVDLDGKPRQVDGNCDGNAVVDPGAYEFALHDFNGNGLVDVQDIIQVAARWNNPAAYDPTYDVAPPFGSPIDIQDIIAIAEQWDSACQ